MNRGLKELMVVDGMMEAEIIKTKLQSQDIPAVLTFESAGRLFGITMNGLGKVKVLVPEADFSRAKKILTQIEDVDEPGE